MSTYDLGFTQVRKQKYVEKQFPCGETVIVKVKDDHFFSEICMLYHDYHGICAMYIHESPLFTPDGIINIRFEASHPIQRIRFRWHNAVPEILLDSDSSYCQPYLGKIPIVTNIFQRGWNHQLDNVVFVYSLMWLDRDRPIKGFGRVSKAKAGQNSKAQ